MISDMVFKVVTTVITDPSSQRIIDLRPLWIKLAKSDDVPMKHLEKNYLALVYRANALAELGGGRALSYLKELLYESQDFEYAEYGLEVLSSVEIESYKEDREFIAHFMVNQCVSN